MFCTVTVGRRRGLKHAADMCVCVWEINVKRDKLVHTGGSGLCKSSDRQAFCWHSKDFLLTLGGASLTRAGQTHNKLFLFYFFKKRNQWQFCPRNVGLFKLFFTLPGGRIQGWQRTACRDRRCRTAAGRMQCALSCRTAGAQPVPAAPPSRKETLP